MEFFGVGDKTSLICADHGAAETVRAALKELGYKCHQAEVGELAIERLRYQAYDVVVLQETFAGSSLRSNPVLNFLGPLPMAQRRNSFICLVGASFKTLDAMQAFAHSVHLVVNPVDLPNLAAIMKKSLMEFDLAYKVFKDAAIAANT
jgi:hypothetical protein